ncbi:hypothetical protein PM082_024878 [Marasmius tenuissimus]|nr:hypothetical protein PM082_024878 [Marasmius tenuissimus]
MSIPVPLTELLPQGQGVKVCPYYDPEERSLSHSQVSRKLLHERLEEEQDARLITSSPSRDIFERTSAYIAAIVRNGCRSVVHESTHYNSNEDSVRGNLKEHIHIIQRGRDRIEGKCDGRIVFAYSFSGAPVVKCEHHSSAANRDHFYDSGISDCGLNLEYLEAVLCEDQEEIDHIESAVASLGYGPKISCRNTANISTQRAFCPHSHRTSTESLCQPLMNTVTCTVTYREYEPLEEFKLEILDLLRKLDIDLPDLTPRRFLAHSTVKAYLKDRLPLIRSPTISDLHISLANRSHLKVYIDAVKKECFPNGTGWKGLLYLKQQQDDLLPPPDHYIRTIVEVDFDSVDDDCDESGIELSRDSKKMRLVVCMTPEGSRRLGSAQYLQSDIAFKRVVGYYEFELAALDRASNTSVTFCRVYLTRKNADAHHFALREIDKVLKQDIKRGLQWRHIHGENVNDHGAGTFILNWVVDQDRAQALGLGLRLQEISESFPERRDMHEPGKLLKELRPYDHLARFLSLCTVHFGRNIQATNTSDEIKSLMRSLVCVEHPNWDDTHAIRTLGGKAAVGEGVVLAMESGKLKS